MEPPYFGLYGNNMYSPRYIVTSPEPSTHSPPQYNVVSPGNSTSVSSGELAPNYYQIQPPSPGEMVIVRTTTVTRNTTSIQPLHIIY